MVHIEKMFNSLESPQKCPLKSCKHRLFWL